MFTSPDNCKRRKLIGVLVVSCLALFLFGSASIAAENGTSSLEIPGKGDFKSIEISFSSWEGDSEGILLKADGTLRTWNEGRSGMTGQYPSGEMQWSLPPEKVDKLVRMLSGEGVLSDTAAKPKGEPAPSKSSRGVRSVTTTEGVYKLTANEDAMDVEELLNKMRFYIPGKGVLEWVQVAPRHKKLKTHQLRLTTDGVLVLQPKHQKKVRKRQGWYVAEDEVFALIDSLETEPLLKAKTLKTAHLVTDEGHFRFTEKLKEIEDILLAFFVEQTELQLGPKQRFDKLVISASQAGMNIYFIEIDSNGRLLAGTDVYPERSPITAPDGRDEIVLPPEKVYELTRFLRTPAIKKLVTHSMEKTKLADETEMEIQLFVKKRDENPAIFGDNIEVYQYQESSFSNISDPKLLVEKFVVKIYEAASQAPADEESEDDDVSDEGEID
jgi:hypothetical protein